MMNYFSKKKKWTAYLILLAFVFTCIVPANLGVAYATEDSTVDLTKTSDNLNKTATPLDPDDYTNVTLSVPGHQDQLGVDIIYITGAYLDKNQVEADLMISSLEDTFTEIVGAGIPVNFGYVPFSYDDKPVMKLTSYKTLDDLKNLKNDLRAAISAASGAYGGENMENALQVAKNMFAASPLAKHPERQHLVLVSSGHTYNFNVGENNDIFSTVPVAIAGSEKAGKYFYGFKAWMQARNKNPNNYPIPKPFSANNDYGDWDTYWAVIDQWAAADKAAGDKVVYNILDTTDYSFGYNDWYNTTYCGSDSTHDGTNTFKSYGIYIHTATQLALKNGYDFANAPRSAHGSLIGNTIDNVPAAAQHAISYERAMWEASNFIDEQITGSGINFYPIYNQMKPAYTNGIYADGTHPEKDPGTVNPDGSTYAHNVTWTRQYIGHSFMNMLARNARTGIGENAVNNSTATDKAFFGPIKEKILYTCDAGSCVEDYIGYKDGEGNFEFVQDPLTIKMTRGDVSYTTTQIETKEGATASYKFTASGQEDFTLDYYYGNGTTTEKFIWTFGEEVSLANRAALTYKLQLTEKNEEDGSYKVNTNNSAVLYPKDSDGNDGEPQVFPIPTVRYAVGLSNIGDITVEKEVRNSDSKEPFTFKLFVREEKGSPYTEDVNKAQEDLDIAINEGIAEGNVFVTTGSAYTIVDGTTLSQYALILTEDETPVMAVTSGSALNFSSIILPELGNAGDILDALKAALEAAYTNLKDMLKGLYDAAAGYTVVIKQEALMPIVDAGQKLEEAVNNDTEWKQLHKNDPEQLTITIGEEVYTTTSQAVTYNDDRQWWEVEFKVYPGTENLVGIKIDSTTGSVISYAITEMLDGTSSTGCTTEIYDYKNETPITRTTSLLNVEEYKENLITLGDNEHEDQYLFVNTYEDKGNGGNPPTPPFTPWEPTDPPENPKKDPENPEETIDDNEVPLGEAEVPEVVPGEPVMEEELEDPEVPLGDAPATGDSANAVPFMALLAAAIGGLAITRRKFN